MKPTGVDWSSLMAVIQEAERRGPGHVVFKVQGVGGYNICRTEDFRESGKLADEDDNRSVHQIAEDGDSIRRPTHTFNLVSHDNRIIGKDQYTPLLNGKIVKRFKLYTTRNRRE